MEYIQSIFEKIMIKNKIDNSKVKEIIQINGLTNKNYKVSTENNEYILRIPGNGTEKMINRKIEKENIVLVNELNIDAKLLYFDEDSGIKISEFIKEAKALDKNKCSYKINMKKITNIFKILHKSNKLMKNEFNIINKIQEYEKLLNECNGEFFEDYYFYREQIFKLEEVMCNLGKEITSCHNDSLAENFILDKNEKLYLIDWEYSGLNDYTWDLASCILENEFSKYEEELFLNYYFEGNVEEKIMIKVLINKIYQDFLWSIWALVKSYNGDDLMEYGLNRYIRMKENFKIFQQKYNFKR